MSAILAKEKSRCDDDNIKKDYAKKIHKYERKCKKIKKKLKSLAKYLSLFALLLKFI